MRYFLLLVWFALFFPLRAQETIIYSNTKVGDILPDLELNNIDNFSRTNIKLSELKQQLLIIDFWATWCGPCIAKIPRMDSVIKALPSEMLFISVSNEPKEKVRAFLDKKEKDMGTKLVIPSITEDTTLSKLFPHYFVPHYVWIKLPERKVIAITNGEEIQFDKLNSVLLTSENAQKLGTKIDRVLDYQISEPLFPYLAQNDSIRNHSFKQYSFFTDYIPNLNSGMYHSMINGDTLESVRFVMKNVSIKAMAAWAYGEGLDFFQDSSIDIEVRQPNRIHSNLSGTPYKKWLEKNSFCYEIKINKSIENRLNSIIRNDLDNYFPFYEFKIEKRPKDSWVLISIGNNDNLKTKGEKPMAKKNGNTLVVVNQKISGLIRALRYPHYVNSSVLLADRTNINFNVDFEINPKSYTNMEDVNSELQKYNVRFVRRVEPVNVLVIKDRN